MIPLLTGLTIGKGVADIFAGLFESNSKKKRIENIQGLLKEKEESMNKQADSRYNEVKRGSVTEGFNAINDLAPSTSGALNPNLRSFLSARVGAEANMKGLDAKYSMQDQANQIGLKSIELEGQKEDFNWLGAISDSATETVGGLMGIEQLKEMQSQNDLVESIFKNTNTSVSEPLGFMKNKLNTKVPETKGQDKFWTGLLSDELLKRKNRFGTK